MKSYAAIAAVGALAARSAHASPFPQAVTAAISPSGAAPATASNAGDVYIISQTSDGQIQVPTTGVTTPVYTPDYTSVIPISEISDGQPQAPAGTPTTTPTTSLKSRCRTPVSSSSTEEATTVVPVSEISDGQPQAPAGTTATIVTYVAATTTTTTPTSSSCSSSAATSVAAVSQISDGQIQSPTDEKKKKNKRSLTACPTSSTLTLTLADGVLHDAHNRTGYIASNYQFQFDAPPQAGALYTAGFSVCSEDGTASLALGGSKTWYRCLSGDFYNLYDRWWAAQCEEVKIEIVEFADCE
ncbi:Covalently-linked cell wall protein [Lasiodiplodia theobromae]|uniref:Covalently-linked cell wall protein n=1 Tax=Lasiodiplodia theobromae TaxID=45133 RepID=UPI0015C3B560|nr:Covalently-linked cell wall protein [Lasiodiplodia theobromae]KAF4540478.1 Covalently-linked cell wall protein [Lasiodiplodia theobromae]